MRTRRLSAFANASIDQDRGRRLSIVVEMTSSLPSPEAAVAPLSSPTERATKQVLGPASQGGSHGGSSRGPASWRSGPSAFGGTSLNLLGVSNNSEGMKELARVKQDSDTPGGGLAPGGGTIRAKVPLGGMVLLKGPSDAAADTVLKVLAGASLSSAAAGARSVVDFLDYIYVPEVAVLLEGSILMNLRLSVSSLRNRKVPTEDEAWHVARRCGLSKAFLNAPEEFTVGRMGRNLPSASRQAVALARCVLADPDVLLLHKPVALLDARHAKKVLAVLSVDRKSVV